MSTSSTAAPEVVEHPALEKFPQGIYEGTCIDFGEIKQSRGYSALLYRSITIEMDEDTRFFATISFTYSTISTMKAIEDLLLYRRVRVKVRWRTYNDYLHPVVDILEWLPADSVGSVRILEEQDGNEG